MTWSWLGPGRGQRVRRRRRRVGLDADVVDRRCVRPRGRPPSARATNTTIGVVATNARLDKVGCLLVAQGGHDGMARALFPPHTGADGDAARGGGHRRGRRPRSTSCGRWPWSRSSRPSAIVAVPGPSPVADSIAACPPPSTELAVDGEHLHPLPRWPRGARRSCSAWVTPTPTSCSSGEGPGAEEDRQGLPVRGSVRQAARPADGRGARHHPRARSTSPTSSSAGRPDNRDPQPDEIAACRPYLEQQLELIDPTVVVTLGKFAGQLLLDTNGPASPSCAATTYPFGDGVLIPTLHPAYALRGGGEPLAQMRADLVRAKQALAGAASSTSVTLARPIDARWTTPGRWPRRWPSWPAPATCSCWPASSVRARPRSPRASARRSASTEPITSPTFTLASQYEGRLELNHLDVYRLEQLAEVARPRPARDARRGRRDAHRVGRRHHPGPAAPTTSRSALDLRRGRRRRASTRDRRRSAPRWSARAPGRSSPGPGRRGSEPGGGRADPRHRHRHASR